MGKASRQDGHTKALTIRLDLHEYEALQDLASELGIDGVTNTVRHVLREKATAVKEQRLRVRVMERLADIPPDMVPYLDQFLA